MDDNSPALITMLTVFYCVKIGLIIDNLAATDGLNIAFKVRYILTGY